MAIKDKLRKIRLLKNFTQVNIEEKTDINNRLVQMYESGKRVPKDENLKKIADALNVNIWALRDIDFDGSNFESTRQLLFLLEEKGLFSITDVSIKSEEIKNSHYKLEIPLTREQMEFFIKWKKLSEQGIQEEFDKWKYNIE